MSEDVFAGIDGGGTKTSIVLVDADGNEVARHTTTTSNAAVIGHDQAGTVLRAAVLHVAGQGSRRLRGAWFGLAGGDRPEDHRRLLPYLNDLASSVRMSNDAELVLAALPGGTGLVVVAGTGSIAFGQTSSGTRVRAGGWGQIIGDEGSGYDLARRMLDAFAGDVDGRSPSSSCTPRLMEQLDLEEPFQIIQWVYAPGRTKADIAALSGIVLEEAAGGDRMALDIVEESAAKLAETARAAAKRLDLGSPLPLALTGGLLVHSQHFRQVFLDHFRHHHPQLEIAIVDEPALTAARAMARATTSGEVT